MPQRIQWVGTKAYSGYADYIFNLTRVVGNDVVFLQVGGQGANFPVDEALIYQWSQSKSGMSGWFVLTVIIFTFAIGGAAVGAALSGTSDAILAGAVSGAAVGAVAGVIATGGGQTGQMAYITPFVDSSYDPSTPNLSGDEAIYSANTTSEWLDKNFDQTAISNSYGTYPDAAGTFIVNIDARKALACGGASKTAATANCTTPAITQINMSDPRFKKVYDEMFHQPVKDLQQSVYPYTQR